ncbi:hypothetical protein PANO111632_17290 [Paracoccus nototheniae]|uniref:Uncharacterized protein n=1 Tax=Paracoccus nototheniae TaxID=2489002 RepID=A0ABW4DWR9_9RHOB|nr:hypothetical protein [Paracoccus nototheniae]
MTPIPDFTIAKLKIIDGGPNERGARLLASFELQIIGLIIEGCVLIENSVGVVRAGGPIGKTSQGHKASVAILDPVLKRALTRRIAAAYSGLTGREVADE